MKILDFFSGFGADWGGDWTSFKDYPHIEFTGGLTYKQIFAGKKPTFTTTKKVSNKADSTKTITIKSGDTLSALAVKNNTTVAAIKKLNELKNDKIYVGQKIKLK